MWLHNVDEEALIITHKGDYNHIFTGFPVNANPLSLNLFTLDTNLKVIVE